MKLKILKQNLIKQLTDSSVYGLSKIIQSTNLFYKIFWSLFILFGSIATVYYVIDAVSDFLEYQVVTKIVSIYEHSMPFPTVSFCPSTANFFDNLDLKKMFVKCTYNLDPSCQLNPDNNFEPFYTDVYGKCYRFNSGKNLTGHSIPLLNSIVGGRDDAFYLRLVPSTGLVFWIHERQSPPKIEASNNYNGIMYYASAGFNTQ